MSTTKRRKLEQDTASNASGKGTSAARRGGGPGSRGGHSAATASRAAAIASGSAAGPSVLANAGAPGSAGAQPDAVYVPVLSLSTLPVSALSKYALHYGLIPPEPLTVAQATFPTPALPLELQLASSYTIPARGRNLQPSDRRHRSPYPGARQPSPSTSHLRPGNATGAATDQRSAETSVEPQTADTPSTSTTGTADAATQKARAMVSASEKSGKKGTASNEGSGAQTPASGGGGDASEASGAAPSGHESKLASQQIDWSNLGEADAQELRGMSAYDGGEDQFRERLGALAKAHWDKAASVKEAETVVNFAYAIRMRSKVLKSAPMV